MHLAVAAISERFSQLFFGFRFDADRSNSIDCGEFLNLLDYLHSSGAVQGAKMGRENASATFRVLDGDGDGRLTRKVRILDGCDDGDDD